MVTRYDPVISIDEGYDVGFAEMEPFNHGAYVTYDDYESLKADYEELKSQIADLYKGL